MGWWRGRREADQLGEMHRLLEQERMDEVLAVPVPREGRDPTGLLMHATGALLTGRSAEALARVAQIRSARVPRLLQEPVHHLEAFALVHQGRYAEAAIMLDSRGVPEELRTLRAQIAIETGDDAAAEHFLTEPCSDELSEAGRLRVQGDALIRRGRPGEGRPLVEQALVRYRGLDQPVDEGYCLVHLVEAALLEGRGAEGVRIAELALERFRLRAHHPDGLALGEAVRAEALAAGARAEEARAALRAAQRHTDRSDSPVLALRVRAAEAEVLAAEGRGDEARAAWRAVVEGHRALGAEGEARRAARRCEELDRGGAEDPGGSGPPSPDLP